jgi:hypothetical protein
MTFDFSYIHTDIPPGITCEVWRRRHARRRHFDRLGKIVRLSAPVERGLDRQLAETGSR